MRNRGANRYKKGLLFLGIILLSLILIGFLLPSTFFVQRSILIENTPQKIFPYANSIPKWRDWTALNPMKDLSLQENFYGPAYGIGSGIKYKGNKVGAGTIEIIDNELNTKVDFKVFINNKIETTGRIVLDPEDVNKTLVTITLEGNVKFNLVNRYIILFMDNVAGPLFDDSLRELKALSERKKDPAP
ncbi:MAG: SRPBCC family protein [Cytophagaceae bacterium]|jgi:hypothetical protein|nr:SRPBCC family protein [Cytophagaceae bacterium]